MSTFLERFHDAANEQGLRKEWSPASCIEAWSSFVADCEEGYQSSIYEFEHELEVRDVIERVLRAPTISDDSAVCAFAEAVAEVDGRFASLLRSGPSVRGDTVPWWLRNLPSYAGPELVADAETKYSVQLHSVDS